MTGVGLVAGDEGRGADPLRESWDHARVEVMQRLDAWAVSHAEVNRGLGAWTGLPTTDAAALGHVVWAAEAGDPLSPAGLARRIGLTSGATSLLLDRLERADVVRRSRESADRRRVTVRPTATARARVRAFLSTAGTEVADVLRRSDPADLAVVADFLRRMTEANAGATARAAATSTAPRAEPVRHGPPDGR